MFILDTTTAGSLRVGDIVVDTDLLELRITSATRDRGMVTLVMVFVEADMMPNRPGQITMRMRATSMVRVPPVTFA